MASQSIMAKFLSDDTLESNQWWEADSHLQKIVPLGSNHSGGTHLQQTKSLWGRTSLGELETYTHSANYRDIHTHYTHEEQRTHE